MEVKERKKLRSSHTVRPQLIHPLDTPYPPAIPNNSQQQMEGGIRTEEQEDHGMKEAQAVLGTSPNDPIHLTPPPLSDKDIDPQRKLEAWKERQLDRSRKDGNKDHHSCELKNMQSSDTLRQSHQ